MLGFLAAEVELVDDLQRVAQRVAGAEAVGDLGKDLADLVLQRVRIVGGFAEGLQIREQLAIDEVDQILAGARVVESGVPSFVFGAAQDCQRYGSSRRGE